MVYTEFFQIFYKRGTRVWLNGCTSKAKTVQFFLKSSVPEEKWDDLAFSDGSSYEHYYDGKVKQPELFFAKIQACFQEQLLTENLVKSLNKEMLPEMLAEFGVQLSAADQADLPRFARALSVQFHLILMNPMDAKVVVAEEYRVTPKVVGYELYCRKALDSFRYISLPNGELVPFKNLFVCNRISPTAPEKLSRNSRIIENATLERLRSYDSRARIDYVLLIGNAGTGKSMMLHSLFLDGLEQHRRTNSIPVLVELRKFSYYSKDLVSSLVSSVQEYDDSLSEESVREYLGAGRCRLLLDGLDELDPAEVSLFQDKLSAFIHMYPHNQIVITSRECNAVKGIRGFMKLFLIPFDDEQKGQLVENILKDVDPEKAKTEILNFVKTAFTTTDHVFATNPLFFTALVLNFRRLDEFAVDIGKLYELMYRTVVRDHEIAKTGYDRIFYSVYDADEFTEVFREFCAVTYIEAVFSFTKSDFEKFFHRLSTPEHLRRPHDCSVSRFLIDACATSCLMYEMDSQIYYVAPGFQEYMFAEFYHVTQDETKLRMMAKAIWNSANNDYLTPDALDMLYHMSRGKVERCLHLPILSAIYEDHSEPVSFALFLLHIYGGLKYAVMDDELIARIVKEWNFDDCQYNLPVNSPQNMIVDHMLRLLLPFPGFPGPKLEKEYGPHDHRAYFYAGVKKEDRDKERVTLQLYFFETESGGTGLSKPPLGLYFSTAFMKEGGEYLPFGFVYEADLESALQDEQKLAELLHLLKSVPGEPWKVFVLLRKYYGELKEKYTSKTKVITPIF